jgi:CHASE2 domain-containing sensor protein
LASKAAPLLNRNRWSYGLVWGLVTLAAASGTQLLSTTRFFQLLSLKAYDANFVLRGKRPTSNVVLVVADDKALNTFSELQAFWHPRRKMGARE